MTRDPKLRGPAQKALDYIVKAQHDQLTMENHYLKTYIHGEVDSLTDSLNRRAFDEGVAAHPEGDACIAGTAGGRNGIGRRSKAEVILIIERILRE